MARAPDQLTREAYLVQALRDLEATYRAARRAKSFVAASQAKAKAIQVRAHLDELRETERRREAPSTLEDHAAEVLTEARRLRLGAAAAGSYVAAVRLLQLEQDLLARARAAADAADAAELAAKTIDEIEREIEELRAQRIEH